MFPPNRNNKQAPPLTQSIVVLISCLLCWSWFQFNEVRAESGLRFDQNSNAYTGLTFTFDPRLEKRIERLHFEHWQSIVRQTSSLLHQTLAGRAHLGQIQVLIPYKWHKQPDWPVLQKPGVPPLMNRHLKYADADILVGFEGESLRE